MKGKHNIKISNKRISYDLNFDRPISIIFGDSGIGKSTILKMIKDYQENGKDSGIRFSTTSEGVLILNKSSNWQELLSKISNFIIFADEYVKYVLTKEFAEAFSRSGNYLVYITRESRTGALTYSIKSMYSIVSSRKEGGKCTQNSLYSWYYDNVKLSKPDLLVTEDSKSGLTIMRALLSCECITSNGKDNIINKLKEVSSKDYKSIYVLVDTAAFGSNMPKLLRYITESGKNITVGMYESLEYILLSTKNFRNFVESELDETYNYVDSSDYLTWEQYYTDLLKSMCKKYGMNYSKVGADKLDKFFTSKSFLDNVMLVLCDIDKSLRR